MIMNNLSWEATMRCQLIILLLCISAAFGQIKIHPTRKQIKGIENEILKVFQDDINLLPAALRLSIFFSLFLFF